MAPQRLFKPLLSPFISLMDNISRIFIYRHTSLRTTFGMFCTRKNIADSFAELRTSLEGLVDLGKMFWRSLGTTIIVREFPCLNHFVFSCGMDACEHEYSSMSRHNRKVPASFYYRFTRDACAFANKYASGKLISVLEGGYSDLALISGSMAHICGLVGSGQVDEEWWNIQNLTQVRHQA